MAAPIRGDGVGVGLSGGRGAVVGIGIVVVLGEELAGGGVTHEARRIAMSAAAARRVARAAVCPRDARAPPGPVRAIR
ncbi:MAG: hypothetical protein M3T56_02795 [Chloroflexota bacterium]|nr:hypothetical protein [Chloroflexota bacterium]